MTCVITHSAVRADGMAGGLVSTPQTRCSLVIFGVAAEECWEPGRSRAYLCPCCHKPRHLGGDDPHYLADKVGNDLAVRVFLGELAGDAGYRIDWSAVPPAALAAACDTGDPEPLSALLETAVALVEPTAASGAGGKRREVHTLAGTLGEVADQLRPADDPHPPS